MESAQASGPVNLLNVDQLAQFCAEETEKFRRRVAHQSAYCFELFRRALVLRNQYAWSKIYEQYQPFVRTWILSHRAARTLGDDVDDVINEAFARLNRAISPEKFEGGFRELAALIAFLKRCTISAILDNMRARQRRPVAELDETVESLVDMHLVLPDGGAEELWRWLDSQLQNENERTVIYASFVYDMTPAQIVEEYPQLFTHAKEIYTIRRNVIARLKRHATATNLQG